MPPSNRQARERLIARLRDRRPEVEDAVLTRVFAVSDPHQVPDPAYAESLRAAVLAAVEHGLAALELGEDRSAPPPELRVQARLAARNDVGIDTVLRRYLAGQAVIVDFVLAEAEREGLHVTGQLQRILRAQAAVFDRLVAAVTDEYGREVEAASSYSRERQGKRVRRLLAGERLDAPLLNYDLAGHHIGLAATGHDLAAPIRQLAKASDRRLLLVEHADDTLWVWLGTRRQLDFMELERELLSVLPSHAHVAVGETTQGISGWRLSHRQALAALPVALRSGKRFVRYADVALLASALQDDVLTTSLDKLYLDRLGVERNGGNVLHETLRAYFLARGNVSSSAASLGVKRHTVTNRLRVIEQRLGRSLVECEAELDIALRLDSLRLLHS